MSIRIAIAVPMERTINQSAFYGFLALAQQGVAFFQLPYMRNDVARNKYAQRLLDSDFTHILMLDSDHIHPFNIVQKLAQWVINDPNKWVVGGLNFRRGEPYDPCAFVKGENDEYYTLREWPQGIVKVDILGTGSILIAREVFERIPAPWFGYDYSRIEKNNWPGTDIWFSKLCNEYGIDLWLDTTTTSPHLIDGLVEESVYRQYLTDHPEEIAKMGDD